MIIAVVNQKGGVGKSTTAAAVGAGLMKAGKSVLFVDLDAQGNLSQHFRAETNSATIYGAMMGEVKAADAIRRTPQGDIIPASPALVGADKTFSNTGREYRLRDALKPLRPLYDVILIDTPPTLGVLTANALTAAQGAIVPAQADAFSLQGIGQLSETVAAVQQYTNPALRLLGIVITRYNGRAILSRDLAQIIDDTARQIGTKAYKTKIRECTALKEAQAVGASIFDYAPRSNAAKDYAQLVAEIIDDTKEA